MDQIVILAAGKGTRMGDLEIPKVLAPLHGKPALTYLLKEISGLSDLEPTVIVVGYKHDQVRSVAGQGYRYVLQEPQLGTAHAVLCAKPDISGTDIIVLYGDMPLIKAQSIQKFMAMHHANNAKISMLTTTVPNFEGIYESMEHFGRIIRSESGGIIKITEFKDASPEEQAMQEVNPGVYMFSCSWVWPYLEAIKTDNAQKEYYLTDIIEAAIQAGEQIHSMAVQPEQVFGINTKEHLDHAHKLTS